MCGIIAATASRPVAELLLAGLARLEYRGYDSAGLAVLENNKCEVLKREGKVQSLIDAYNELSDNKNQPWAAQVGIAHTRWATHGEPNQANAHPHYVEDWVAVVHNGIIENHAELRAECETAGATFTSDTDSEVIAQLIALAMQNFIKDKKTNKTSQITAEDMTKILQSVCKRLHGAYALAILSPRIDDHIFAVRQGSPLVLGVGVNEHFVASDVLALAPFTQQVIFLEQGDIACISAEEYKIFDLNGDTATRELQVVAAADIATEKGEYRHFMQKEIMQQAEALQATWQAAWQGDAPRWDFFQGDQAADCRDLFKEINHVHIVACGTSYHAGAAMRDSFEENGIAAQVEVASEYLYRKVVVLKNTLVIFISQSGETADTLAACEKARTAGYSATMAICNVNHSSLTEVVDFYVITRAGREIGVAATKTFTTQLLALQATLFAICVSKNILLPAGIEQWQEKIKSWVDAVLKVEPQMQDWAQYFINKSHALYLGRGALFPIAQEGALKLKEISYVHAEAYPAGELKHGPLALIDEDMPVVALAPDDALLEKMCGNLAEVSARGGELFVLAERSINIAKARLHCLTLPSVPQELQPLLYTLPLQLLAYHVGVLKGTDVDQPRNLAKSVTVE